MDRISHLQTPAATSRPAPARTAPVREAEEPRERYLSPDMAQMLDDIRRAEQEMAQAREAARAQAEAQAEPQVTAPVVAGTDLPTAVAAHALHHADHEKHEKHAHRLTGTHLGLEAGEMVAKQAGVLASHGGGHAAPAAAAEAASAVGEAHGHAAGEAAAEALAHAAEAGGLLTAGVLVGGALGSAVVGIGMGALAYTQLKGGIKNQDKEQIMEGTGAALLGARSTAAAVALAGYTSDGVLGAVAQGAHAVLAPLGVAHGAIDTALGGRRIYQGVQQKDARKITLGTLTTGFGVALIASAVGGGLPAVAAAGALLAGKVAYKVWTARHPVAP